MPNVMAALLSIGDALCSTPVHSCAILMHGKNITNCHFFAHSIHRSVYIIAPGILQKVE